MPKKISSPVTIATLGSHSALDICRGAKDLGFQTLVIAERGREKTYARYFRSQADGLGCVDECKVLPKFKDILQPEIQKYLQQRKAIFIPHRSLEAYLNFDYDSLEKKFKVPMFGNRFLLRMEERTARPNQYDYLDAAGIRYPKHFQKPAEIDRLCLVKLSEKTRPHERAFFLAHTPEEYKKISASMVVAGKITREALETAVIEEFVLGAQVNFHFFYSPLLGRLELLGTDTRRQTNLDGLLRLPAVVQQDLPLVPSYEEAGHYAVTVLESLLEPAFAMGEAFVKATQKLCAPGIIGPFALQSIITAGPPKKELVVIDVSPRMPGSPGMNATPYSEYLYGERLSMGKRVAMEIRQAVEQKKVAKVVT